VIPFDRDALASYANKQRKGTMMSTSLRTLAASTLLVASMTAFAGTASAAPVVDRLAIKNASPSTIEFVQWRGGGWGWGAPVAGALVAGALLGGALAAPYYYGPGPYYYPRPYYAPAPAGYYAPGYGPPPGGDAVAYCMQRFRSYNPRSGTYLGTDGRRHSCP
jgi:BA14K-like protein